MRVKRDQHVQTDLTCISARSKRKGDLRFSQKKKQGVWSLVTVFSKAGDTLQMKYPKGVKSPSRGFDAKRRTPGTLAPNNVGTTLKALNQARIAEVIERLQRSAY